MRRIEDSLLFYIARSRNVAPQRLACGGSGDDERAVASNVSTEAHSRLAGGLLFLALTRFLSGDVMMAANFLWRRLRWVNRLCTSKLGAATAARLAISSAGFLAGKRRPWGLRP